MPEPLEPCPFCGADGSFSLDGESLDVVECVGCNAHIHYGSHTYGPDFNDGARLWNRRAKPALTPEQRAALEWAIAWGRSQCSALYQTGEMIHAGLPMKHPNCGCYVAETLRALLDGSDEKGGGGPAHVSLRDSRPDREIAGESRGLPVAGAASTAPPDSPASEESDAKIAARVEALGLEPSEREQIRQVVRWCGVLGSRGAYQDTMSPFQEMTFKLCADIIAALAPIADRKP